MKAKLTVLQGAKTKELRLQLPTVIGRGRESTIKLPASTVSRTHSEIYEFEGQLVVRDLGSANGTLVNGVRIEGPTYVTIDDEISIGPLTFRLEVIEESAGEESRFSESDSAPLSNDAVAADVASTENPAANDSEDDLSAVGQAAEGIVDEPHSEPAERQQGEPDDPLSAFSPAADVPVFVSVPADSDMLPADVGNAEEADDSSLIESPAYLAERELAEGNSEDSVLRYEESADGEHSFVDIVTSSEGSDNESLPIEDLQIPGPASEVVSEAPNLDGIAESARKVVDAGDSDLNAFFKNFDSGP